MPPSGSRRVGGAGSSPSVIASGDWSRRWGWRYPRARVLDRINTDVIRPDAVRSTVLDKISEREAARGGRCDPAQGHRELCPGIRVTSGRVVRIDVEQERDEITNAGCSRTDVCARSIQTLPHLQPVGENRIVDGASIEGKLRAVL